MKVFDSYMGFMCEMSTRHWLRNFLKPLTERILCLWSKELLYNYRIFKETATKILLESEKSSQSISSREKKYLQRWFQSSLQRLCYLSNESITMRWEWALKINRYKERKNNLLWSSYKFGSLHHVVFPLPSLIRSIGLWLEFWCFSCLCSVIHGPCNRRDFCGLCNCA